MSVLEGAYYHLAAILYAIRHIQPNHINNPRICKKNNVILSLENV